MGTTGNGRHWVANRSEADSFSAISPLIPFFVDDQLLR